MRSWTAYVLGVATLLGCDWELPPQNHIEATEIFMIRHEVELGALDPERVGPQLAGPEAPIAEALPGDIAHLEAVVVDVEGRALPADELETLWLQCGGRPCEDPSWGSTLEDYSFEVTCAELPNYNHGDVCRLGTGTGEFAFVVPQLSSWGGLLTSYDPSDAYPRARMYFYVVVAWGGKSAEDCWRSRRGDRADLDHCGFTFHDLQLGPTWWLYDYAASLDIEPPIDPTLIPALALQQPANRVPRAPTLSITIDGELAREGVPPFEPIPVDVGARVRIQLTFDSLSQLFQSTFEPVSWDVTDAFVLRPERVRSFPATSGAMRSTASTGSAVTSLDAFSFEVVDDPDAGGSRVLIGYEDEGGARDYVSVEFVPR